MQTSLTEEILIDASPERVFAAWTEAAHLMAWWGDDTQFRTVAWHGDVQPAGRWRVDFCGVTGSRFAAHGEYLRVERPWSLSFTWKPEWDNDPPTRLDLEFQPVKSGTLLKLTQSGFPSAAKRDASQHAWGQTTAWLRTYLEQPRAATVNK